MKPSNSGPKRGALQQTADAGEHTGEIDPLAKLVLELAVKVIEGVVTKKRGDAVVEAVRRGVHRERDYLVLGFKCARETTSLRESSEGAALLETCARGKISG
jgi:hypothetical protein